MSLLLAGAAQPAYYNNALQDTTSPMSRVLYTKAIYQLTRYNLLGNITLMATDTKHCYIIRNNAILGGEPIIKGTRTSVRDIVENWRLGLSPEEIVIHFPHLTLAQVFDALSYYSDNQDEINTYIEQNKVSENLSHASTR